jgi:hypothetical protein
MPATPSTTNPPEPAYPERTQADWGAMFASVVWFREKGAEESYEKYKGMYVAILGERIIDADHDEKTLIRRLDALGDSVSQNRIVIQYLSTMEEEWQY